MWAVQVSSVINMSLISNMITFGQVYNVQIELIF